MSSEGSWVGFSQQMCTLDLISHFHLNKLYLIPEILPGCTMIKVLAALYIDFLPIPLFSIHMHPCLQKYLVLIWTELIRGPGIQASLLPGWLPSLHTLFPSSTMGRHSALLGLLSQLLFIHVFVLLKLYEPTLLPVMGFSPVLWPCGVLALLSLYYHLREISREMEVKHGFTLPNLIRSLSLIIKGEFQLFVAWLIVKAGK